MKKDPRLAVILRFSYYHWETDGKLENVLEALNQIDAERFCLDIRESRFAEQIWSRTIMDQRLERAKKVVAKLRRHGISSELILPGMLPYHAGAAKQRRLLQYLYGRAGEVGVKIMWVDDAGEVGIGPYKAGRRSCSRRQLIGLARNISGIVHRRRPKTRLGLIASGSEQYAVCGLTAGQLAGELAGGNRALLAQSQPFGQDYNRVEILQAAQSIMQTAANCSGDIELLGSIDHRGAASFHKSAEATQMQINLNVLYGAKAVLLNCFDQLGTAPGTDNLYLTMCNNAKALLAKLSRLMSCNYQHLGVGIVDNQALAAVASSPGVALDSWPRQDCWPSLLWRLGISVCATESSAIRDVASTEHINPCPYVLTGSAPGGLSQRQLNYVFQHGVLLDADAAECVQEMGRSDLLGVKVGGPVKSVQCEVISDQAFAAAYYGRRTLLSGHLTDNDFRRLRPVHAGARPITTLLSSKSARDIPGVVVFDDQAHNRRCAILPYSFPSIQASAALLDHQRQQHLHDILCWLNRGRLTCYVENTPDLVPFVVLVPQRRRIILALLNVSFDWAIDSRIRWGALPFAIKRVRELDEQGKMVTHSKLRLTQCRDYQYLQLNAETAVAPMQMTVLLLEG